MAAQIICAMQSKGGAGKSTLLCSLVAVLARDGARVLGIDADPQRTFERFHDAADSSLFDIIADADPPKLVPTVEAHRSNYDVILIDTPGVESQAIVYAAAVSDLILIPTGPSEPDALGAIKTWDHVKATQLTRRTNPADVLVILNEYRPNTRVTSHITAAITDAEAPLFPVGLPALSGFKEMHTTGALPDGAAGRALDELVEAMRSGGHLWFYRGGERNGQAA